jgi:hypothetical protein
LLTLKILTANIWMYVIIQEIKLNKQSFFKYPF